MSLLGVLLVVFVVLKLVGVIAWSWFWVLSPLWGWLVLYVALLVIGLAGLAGMLGVAARRSARKEVFGR